jgi:putative transcriptional regulator
MKTRREKDHPSKRKEMEITVENEILEGLADFTDALEKGEVLQRLTCRQINLDLQPTEYSPELVKKTRKALGVSQTVFARFLGVSPKTVRSWEQGVNSPSPMACRFMDEIRGDPPYWMERLRRALVSEPSCKGLPL